MQIETRQILDPECVFARFLRSEAGAVTVDQLPLLSTAVMLGLMIAGDINDAVMGSTHDLGSTLSDVRPISFHDPLASHAEAGEDVQGAAGTDPPPEDEERPVTVTLEDWTPPDVSSDLPTIPEIVDDITDLLTGDDADDGTDDTDMDVGDAGETPDAGDGTSDGQGDGDGRGDWWVWWWSWW